MKKGTLLVTIIAAITTLAVVAPFPVAAMAAENTSATITMQGGPLTLDSAPSITFGNLIIDGEREDFTSTSSTQALQVKDNRGSGAGWNVTVALSKFKLGSKDSLNGAIFTFNTAPVLNGKSTAPTASTGFTLTPGGDSVRVLNAPADHGLGKWQATWAADSFNLNVPMDEQRVGLNTATLTWTLADTPA